MSHVNMPYVTLAPGPQNSFAALVIAQPYLQTIGEGKMVGHTLFHKFGIANNVASAVDVDVWENNSAYVFPASQIQMQVVSDNAADAAAGSGVQQVKLFYLDNAYAEHTETITLNGVTPVLTVATNIFRVQDIEACRWGVGLKAAGTISIQAVGGATTYGIVSAGFNRCRSGIYTVPAGKNLYLTSLTVSVLKGTTGNFARFILRANYDPLTPAITTVGAFLPLSEIGHMDGGFERAFESPIKIPATCDVKLSVIAGQTATQIVSGMRGWLEAT